MQIVISIILFGFYSKIKISLGNVIQGFFVIYFLKILKIEWLI